MRNVSLLLAAALTFAAGAASAAPTKDVSPYPMGERSIFSQRATIERIQPVGTVCVEGEECGPAAPAKAAAAGPRSGDAVYNAACASCHGAGVLGAPIVGNAGDWSPRISKGMSTLVKHAIEGFKAMPAKGGCMDCSDKEIEAAVKYMVEQSK